MGFASYWMAVAWIFSFFTTIAFAYPQAATPTNGTSGSATACAQVAAASAAALARNPAAAPTVPASLAFQCLQSVPNKPEPAQKLIESVKAFVQWQSSLAWLKDPPASYMLPPIDVIGSLDNISATAVAGGFTSEYDFQLAIIKTFAAAHDGHFSYRPDVFKAFAFRNRLASDLVSISRDGVEAPKLYHFAALRQQAAGGTGNSTLGGRNGTAAAPANGTATMPPAITKINGQDAAKLIEDLNLQFSGFQDPDSQWNAQFPNYANPAGVLTVAASVAFQGNSVTLTYDNGQEKTEESFATLRTGANFTGITSGEDFYNKFCNPEAAAAAVAAARSKPSPTLAARQAAGPAPTIAGYPFPVIRDSGADATAGYFLNGTGYDNVAVLAVSGFSPLTNVGSLEYLTNFQDTVARFLAQSKEAGKTKLVIDLTANGGGFVVAGFDLFAQLFPDVDQFQANNIRLSKSLSDMGNIIATLPNAISINGTQPTQEERQKALALSILRGSAVTTNLVPGGVFTPEGQNFASVEEILGPITLQGDNFTAYQQAPLNDTSADFNLTGTGSRANPPASVFAPEDIVLLTDGTCGSTCTLFSYLMILQLDVKTVAVGGRPQTGPMQGIAGVEGAQVFALGDLNLAAQAAIVLAPDDQVAGLQKSELGLIAEGYMIDRAAVPASAGAVNGKNAFMKSDAETPLQFLFEPANCRFFYTQDMIFGPTEVWKRAVDAAWTNPETFCVEGSRMNMTADQRLDPLFRLSVMPGPYTPKSAATGSAAAGGFAGSVRVSLTVAAAVVCALLM